MNEFLTVINKMKCLWLFILVFQIYYALNMESLLSDNLRREIEYDINAFKHHSVTLTSLYKNNNTNNIRHKYLRHNNNNHYYIDYYFKRKFIIVFDCHCLIRNNNKPRKHININKLINQYQCLNNKPFYQSQYGGHLIKKTGTYFKKFQPNMAPTKRNKHARKKKVKIRKKKVVSLNKKNSDECEISFSNIVNVFDFVDTKTSKYNQLYQRLLCLSKKIDFDKYCILHTGLEPLFTLDSFGNNNELQCNQRDVTTVPVGYPWNLGICLYCDIFVFIDIYWKYFEYI